MPEQYWNHNAAFHDEILAETSTRGGRACDVGCWEGLLLQRLAGVCEEIVGIEVDPATARLLPGSRVRRRFYYRYTLTWDRPAGLAPEAGR
ncbi:hypothetical protein ACSL103130_01365 [Actinomyces slackii]|uniref:Uncharacterized protein n=1 Tax=Actinomyces slackii TaxID=52774 RepID=A0A448KET5_9ACTO|nr:hypothetical protein [Actinomyces slackii]VEG75464.1 Uncharacterised protein [Actinomyces slackii]